MSVSALVLLAALSVSGGVAAQATQGPSGADTRAEAIRLKLEDPSGGIVVVAHAGCHNSSPAHHITSAPENSLAALEHCVRLGVDIMEADVRRSKDGALVIMQDVTVDRTTNGSGRVADLKLAQLKRLRLRAGFGGKTAGILSDQRVLTLAELLAATRGRLLLSLDTEADIDTRVVATAAAANMTRWVLVNSRIAAVERPQADQLPYSQVTYIPVIVSTGARPSTDFRAVTIAQIAATHRIAAVRALDLSEAEFSAVAAATRWGGVRLWADVLPNAERVSVVAKDGHELLHDDAAAWAIMLAHGVTVLQTEDPAALLDYLHDHGTAPGG